VSSRDFYGQHLNRFLVTVRELVERESPTSDIEGITAAASYIEDFLRQYANVETNVLEGFGPLILAERPGTSTRVLLLAHVDTVWPTGSWPCLWRQQDGLIHGPGVYDMKAGVMCAAWLLRYVEESGRCAPTIQIVVNPDEETGSTASRGVIEKSARRADFVLVLEPTTSDGVLKVARKGSGEFRVRIHGRAAHQGVEPERGVNAVVEAAHLITDLVQIEARELGTTVGPNVVHGGSVSNVVPDLAEILIDVRAWTKPEMERVTTALTTLRPRNPSAHLDLTGEWNRPPMESTPLSMALYDRASSIAERLGVKVQPARWGGSSDANLAAAVGAPTIDGFGPAGAGAHQLSEHIVVSHIPDRLALLTELVVSLADEPFDWLREDAAQMYRSRLDCRSDGAP